MLGLAATQVPLTGAGATDDVVGTLTGSLPVLGDAIDFATGGGLINVSVTLDPAVGGSGGGSGNTSGSGSTAHFAGVTLAARVVRVSRSGVARIVLRCPSGAAGSCAGRLALRFGRIGLGPASFRAPAGSRARVNLHVSKKGRKLLRRSGRLSVRASLSSHDASGQRKTGAAALTLKRAQPKTTRTTT